MSGLEKPAWVPRPIWDGVVKMPSPGDVWDTRDRRVIVVSVAVFSTPPANDLNGKRAVVFYDVDDDKELVVRELGDFIAWFHHAGFVRSVAP